MKCLLRALILLFCYQPVRADFYQGIRQMGMGGAAVAVVNDETSILLNPVGLSRLREPYVTVIDPEITTNMGSTGSMIDLSLDGSKIDKLYPELEGNRDERFFYRGQIFPSFATRHYGLGILAKNEVTATRLGSNDFLRLNYVSDQAAAIGYNHSLYGGTIKIAMNGRLIDRVAYVGDLDPAVQGLNLKNLAQEGVGFGADVAVNLTSPTEWLPTLSFIYKDLGDTSFTLGNGSRDYSTPGDPAKISRALDVAVALFPIHSKSMRSTFTVEYDDVIDSDGEAKKKLHIGSELNFNDWFFLRGGYNKGYPTLGLEWANRNFQFQIAYYGEEVGVDLVPIKDERLALKLLLRF